MAKVLEALIAKGRRAKRPREQKKNTQFSSKDHRIASRCREVSSMAQVAAMKGTLQAMAESTETISSRGREANLLLRVISEYLPEFGYAREPVI